MEQKGDICLKEKTHVHLLVCLSVAHHHVELQRLWGQGRMMSQWIARQNPEAAFAIHLWETAINAF